MPLLPPPPPPPPPQVREQGESAAVMGMMDALTGCLAQGGCFAVPGQCAAGRQLWPQLCACLGASRATQPMPPTRWRLHQAVWVFRSPFGPFLLSFQ